ncbi:MAG: MoaD/ThiS family protein [Chloroflexi bacterium]|nr:MoaD/ThiS family protein [Chloroflexota bacterium]MDA8186899.1 MoaD/ThiS family protein [Dehalococcoidales bacterium]
MVLAKVKLYATLRRYTPETPLGTAVELDLPAGSTIADISQRFQMSPSEIKLIFVNGLRQEISYVVQNGDDIAFFPPIAGGFC